MYDDTLMNLTDIALHYINFCDIFIQSDYSNCILFFYPFTLQAPGPTDGDGVHFFSYPACPSNTYSKIIYKPVLEGQVGQLKKSTVIRPCCLQGKRLKKTSTINLTSTTTYNGVAGREEVTLYNAALFLGPGLSVWVGCAGVGDVLSTGAAW